MERFITKEIRALNHRVRNAIDVIQPPNDKIKNLTQFQILVFLNNSKKDVIYQKDICESLNLKKSSITEALDQMEYNDLIYRIPDKEDKRKNAIKLTNKSINEHNMFRKSIEKINKKMVRGLTDKQIEEFFTIIDIMNNNLKED